MNNDIITMFVNASSFRSLIFEIILVSLIFVLNFKARKRPELANYLHGLRRLLIIFMPTVIFVDVLHEIHVPMYLSVLAFLVVFVCWLVYHLKEDRKENKFLGWIFIALASFVIILFVILYPLSY